MRSIVLTSLYLMVVALLFVGCGDDDGVVSTDSAEETTGTIASAYVLNNSATANSVLWYTRSSDGSLSFNSEVATGGSGTGTDLYGVNGSLVYDPVYGVLYAVNTGSNSISAFLVQNDGSLTLLDTENSQGVRPVSLAVSQSLIYVANQGDATHPANVAGFVINGENLVPVLDSVQPLSTDQADPGQVRFTSSPTVIVVSERANDAFSTYLINSSLAAGQRTTASSAGFTPGGFDFTPNGVMVAAEAQDLQAGAGSASSYVVGSSGSVAPISQAIANGQSGSGSALVLSNGAYAFVGNPDSNTLSTYSIDSNGALTLQNGSQSTGAGPRELAVSQDEAYLYSLNHQDSSISVFGLNRDTGALTAQTSVSGLPANALGLAVR